MKWFVFFGVTLLFNLSCSKSSSEKGTEIINRSIEAHGGTEAYKQLDGIILNKTIRLFSEEGSLESEVVQKQSFQFIPHYILQIEWKEDSTSHKLTYNGVEVYKKQNDSVITDLDELANAQNTLKGAEYVFFQPFKLNDHWTELTYLGKQKLNDTLEVSEVKVTDPENPEADIWWYYFDSTDRLVANKVKHKGKYSLIENLKFQKYKGLLFNQHRKSYFVDSLGNKKYLRAEYFYDIID